MSGLVDNSVNVKNYRRQPGDEQVLKYTGLTNRGSLTNEDLLWGDCPLINAFLDPTIGFLYDEPFATYDATNDWTLTPVTAGSAAISVTVPGALTIDSGDTTTLHGAQIQRLKAAFLPASGKDIWFEVTVLLGTSIVGDFFFGLAASDTSIIASSANSTNNRIGWTSVTADGVALFDTDKGGTGATAAAATLSITVPHTFGFRYDATADTLQQYVDGVATGSAVATTYISKSVMYPSFVCQNHGTTQPTMTISGLRIFQLR